MADPGETMALERALRDVGYWKEWRKVDDEIWRKALSILAGDMEYFRIPLIPTSEDWPMWTERHAQKRQESLLDWELSEAAKAAAAP